MILEEPRQAFNNRWKTAQLFYGVRTLYTDTNPIFHLYDDHPGLINARKTFIELNDPTGYKWAETYLGDWNHFQALLRCVWFKEAYDSWCRELAIKLKSEALSRIAEIAQSNTPQSITAAKYLAEVGWEKAGRGRPSKDEINKELRNQIKLAEMENEDLARIGLKPIQGSK